LWPSLAAVFRMWRRGGGEGGSPPSGSRIPALPRLPISGCLSRNPLLREPRQGKLCTCAPYNPVENPKRCQKLSPLFSHVQSSGTVLTFSFISNIRLYNLFRTPGINSIHPVQFINSLIPKCISSYPRDAPKRATRNAAKTADQLSKGPRHHDSGRPKVVLYSANMCGSRKWPIMHEW
jgi:hypothetical protein